MNYNGDFKFFWLFVAVAIVLSLLTTGFVVWVIIQLLDILREGIS